jgi:hypothetical protein
MGADGDRGGFTRWVDLGRLLELDGDQTLERALVAADGNGRPEHDPGRRVRRLVRRIGAFVAGALTAVGAMTLIGRLSGSPEQGQLRPEESSAPTGVAAVDRPDAVVLTLSPRPAISVEVARHRPKGKGASRPVAAAAAAAAARSERAAAQPATLLPSQVRGVYPAPAVHLHHARPAASAPPPEPAPGATSAANLKPAKATPKPTMNPAMPAPKPTTTPKPTGGVGVTATVPATTHTPTPPCTDTAD